MNILSFDKREMKKGQKAPNDRSTMERKTKEKTNWKENRKKIDKTFVPVSYAMYVCKCVCMSVLRDDTFLGILEKLFFLHIHTPAHLSFSAQTKRFFKAFAFLTQINHLDQASFCYIVFVFPSFCFIVSFTLHFWSCKISAISNEYL